MTEKNDGGSNWILLIVIIFLIVNQCSVDDRLDKLEYNKVIINAQER